MSRRSSAYESQVRSKPNPIFRKLVKELKRPSMVNTKVLNDSADGNSFEGYVNPVVALSPQTYKQGLKKHLNMQGSFERARKVPEKRSIPAQRIKAALNQSERLNESTKTNTR